MLRKMSPCYKNGGLLHRVYVNQVVSVLRQIVEGFSNVHFVAIIFVMIGLLIAFPDLELTFRRYLL
jgi:hypothetical protein